MKHSQISRLQITDHQQPEMVDLNSTLYNEHPDWILHAGKHARTMTRNQFVLNVGLPEVQNFIIDTVSRILDSGSVSYVKWDNNRGKYHATYVSCISNVS